MLDLDGFKSANDAYGHAIGDQTLIEPAQRVSAIMREGAVFTRIGGDEFAVILPAINSRDDPTVLARRIVGAVAGPFSIGPISASVGVGVGIAIAPSDGVDPELLVQRADQALHRANSDGCSCIRFFEADMDAHVEHRIAIETALRAAVAAKSIVPHHQPVVAFAGKRVNGRLIRFGRKRSQRPTDKKIHKAYQLAGMFRNIRLAKGCGGLSIADLAA